MARSLKRSVEIIKARAAAASERARGAPARGARARDDAPDAVADGHAAGPPADTAGAGVQETDVEESKVEETEVEVAAVLERYKSGRVGPIEAIEPGEEKTVGAERFFLIRREGGDIDPAADGEAAAFARLGAWPDLVRTWAHGSHAPGETVDARFEHESVCFLDIETTGLSPTTYLFLIGLMFWERGRLVAELVFARDYSEERAVLRYVRDTLSRFSAVVTYNGERFDLPFVETRLAASRVGPLDPIASVDLLHAARRAYGRLLPNCRLGTVERHIRGVERSGDIPGRHIPAAYHDYVRTGDARAMKNVLYHNRMDLFTMVVLLNRLAAAS